MEEKEKKIPKTEQQVTKSSAPKEDVKKKDEKIEKQSENKKEEKEKKELKPQEEKISQPEERKSPDTGINLIPTMSKEEIQVAESKKKLNVGSVVSLMLVVVVSMGIVGFNIFSKMQVNNAKDRLYAHEDELNAMSEKIVSNSEIIERIRLYQDIQDDAYSPKDVIEYINTITTKSGQGSSMEEFSFGDDLAFSFSGSSNDLEDVSKLWYLLTHDENVETVNLDSVGKGTDGARFTFEGKLVYESFLNSSEE